MRRRSPSPNSPHSDFEFDERSDADADISPDDLMQVTRWWREPEAPRLALLVGLYTLQGIPVGLVLAALPYLLKVSGLQRVRIV